MIKSIINKLILLIVFISILGIFLNLDGNIDFRLLSKDINRFLNTSITINELSYSLIYGLLYFTSFLIFEKFLFKIMKSQYQTFLILITLNFGIFFSFIYLSRIYSISRLIIILYLFSNILVSLIYFNYKNSYVFNFIYYLIPLVFIFLSTNSNTDIPTSLAEKNIFSENVEQNYIQFDNSIVLEVNHPGFNLYKTLICCEELNFVNSGGKSFGQIEIVENQIYYISGSGLIFKTNISNFLQDGKIYWNKVENNLTEIIENKYVFDLVNWESIKGFKYHNGNFYLSYIQESEDNCVSLEISSAVVSDNLNFKKIFSPNECIPRTNLPYIAHQAGGALEFIDNENLIFSTGDFRDYSKSQNVESIYGKLIKLNTNTRQYNIIGLGVRNPQGISITDNPMVIVFTEHGPDGGDEINLLDLNNSINNYGWPISSYGYHYDGSFKAEAPLYKSHTEYGYIEPILYFDLENNPNHGISDIQLIHNSKNQYLVSTLYGNLLYRFTLDSDKYEISNFETFRIGERIRDIESVNENTFILLLEDSPSIALLEFKK